MGLVDSLFTNGNKPFGQSDGCNVRIAEGIVTDACYVVCLAVVGDLCGNHNISCVCIRIVRVWFAVCRVNNTNFIFSRHLIFDAVFGEL